MISYKNRKVGILGFGLVGTSALRYFHSRGAQCTIHDQRILNTEEQIYIKNLDATIWTGDLVPFLSSQDYVIASPGIDISAYKEQGNFICELDLFAHEWHKPTIAITGTIGKTSLTTLIYHLLQKEMPVLMAGNIGTPMLDSIAQQTEVDLAILEVSSWQLEHTQSYAPDIALWTNLYPNHLDRHKTMHAYFDAKAHLIIYQTKQQTALLPLCLWHQIHELNIQSQPIWIHTEKPEQYYLTLNKTIIYLHNNQIILYKDGTSDLLLETASLSKCTFIQNWLYAVATLYCLKLSPKLANDCSIQLEHRLEKVRTYRGITFYNDSKGTTIEATLAALEQFKEEKIILFLGGTSKGVDRSALIKQLSESVVLTLCFGSEATALKAMCDQWQIKAIACTNLNDALAYGLTHAHDATIALFSPAGASYDLYANYQERGTHFKGLINAL